ncbi:EthD family reductase [Nocardia alni]|uniref:EthD family reductase n=1 Tax=Nocardia alni TaxID=2815723 RepID=UPI0020B45619|nr:EthD family reductase [Nocardia alni]
MPRTVDAVEHRARLVVVYETPSDIDPFERHHDDVHIPLAKQYPGLRRYTRGHDPATVGREPYTRRHTGPGRRGPCWKQARARDRPSHCRGCHCETCASWKLSQRDPAARRGLIADNIGRVAV